MQREMEASLVPELHLIEQLEKEIEREKALLKNDEDQLNQLTKNAAREESLRKQQMKKVLILTSMAESDASTIKGNGLGEATSVSDQFGFIATRGCV